jgi:hypothetical protein
MKRAGQTTVQCQITNIGGAPSGNLDLLLPPIPWLTAAAGTQLPSLPPGAGTTLSLLLTPPADLALGAHQGSLAIVGANVNLTVPFTCEPLAGRTLAVTAGSPVSMVPHADSSIAHEAKLSACFMLKSLLAGCG